MLYLLKCGARGYSSPGARLRSSSVPPPYASPAQPRHKIDYSRVCRLWYLIINIVASPFHAVGRCNNSTPNSYHSNAIPPIYREECNADITTEDSNFRFRKADLTRI